MNIVFNGKMFELNTTCTLADVLSDHRYTKGVPVEQAVVAVNQTLIHKSDYQTRVLQDGDQIEMLTAVVGG